MRFARHGGRTVMTHARLAAPISLVRPFAVAGGRLVVPLVTIGPGLCAGDTCVIDVRAERGAHVILTTTAAGRILGMADGGVATQRVRIAAAPGATVEYHPALAIPFPDSAFEQEIDVDLVEDARVAVTELWALGRTARGEYLRFRSIASRTRLRLDGRLVYADALLIDAGVGPVRGAGALEGRRYLATGVWHGVALSPEGSEAPLQDGDGLVAFGGSAPGRVYLRALGDEGQRLARLVDAAASRVAAGWGLEPVSLDRFRN